MYSFAHTKCLEESINASFANRICLEASVKSVVLSSTEFSKGSFISGTLLSCGMDV